MKLEAKLSKNKIEKKITADLSDEDTASITALGGA